MSSPPYSTAKNEIKDIKLNLTGYVTQKEFGTENADVSDFVLKTNVAELKFKIDKFNEDDIKKLQESVQEFQDKNLIEQKYLLSKPMDKYLSKTNNTENILSWKSIGKSDNTLNPLYNTGVPKLLRPYLTAIQVSFLRKLSWKR